MLLKSISPQQLRQNVHYWIGHPTLVGHILHKNIQCSCGDPKTFGAIVSISYTYRRVILIPIPRYLGSCKRHNFCYNPQFDSMYYTGCWLNNQEEARSIRNTVDSFLKKAVSILGD